MPPLAGLVVLADLEAPRDVTLTVEPAGNPEVILWRFIDDVRRQLQPSKTGPLGRLVYDLDCAATQTDNAAPLSRIALLVRAGEQSAEVALSAELGDVC